MDDSQHIKKTTILMPDLSQEQLLKQVVLAHINNAVADDNPRSRAKLRELSQVYEQLISSNEFSEYQSFHYYVIKNSVELAKKLTDSGILNTEILARAVYQGFIESATEFVADPDKFGSTYDQRKNNVINNIVDCFQQQISVNYDDLVENSMYKKSCLITVKAILQAYGKTDL